MSLVKNKVHRPLPVPFPREARSSGARQLPRFSLASTLVYSTNAGFTALIGDTLNDLDMLRALSCPEATYKSDK
jgi:hypothetical protein